MEKTNINPAILQEMLDSAGNARDKGQSQFFTPHEFGQKLALALPPARRCVVDLSCGNGQLLQACANRTTEFMLGLDIDPGRGAHAPRVSLDAPSQPTSGPEPSAKARLAAREARALPQQKTLPIQRITRDLTRAYTRLQEIDWPADLIVLNPPFRLYWHRERLEGLLESRLPAVADAFRGVEEQVPRGTIDSTIASLLIGLDRLTAVGEGLIIGNNNTFERLIFAPGAPHAAIGRHIWARLVVPGNPMTGLDHCNHERQNEGTELEYKTGVLYFAREHEAGPIECEWPSLPGRQHRLGAEAREWTRVDRTVELWQTAREQIKIDADAARQTHPYHLWLTAGGSIATHLSRFEEASVKVDKAEAARLHQLRGKLPMQLVMQRNERDELLHVAGAGAHAPRVLLDAPPQPASEAGPSARAQMETREGACAPRWRVDPALTSAIQRCLTEYHAARAPLYPLSEIMRLGYCDEVDFLECRKDLVLRQNSQNSVNSVELLLFRAGQSYRLRTQTVKVTRKVRKPNSLTGELEDLEYSGQELAMYLTADDEWEYCFMEGTLRAPNTKLDVTKGVTREKGARHNSAGAAHPTAERAIDFSLQELVAHFTIPDVPDVASVNPEGYKKNLQTLQEIEQLTEALNQLPA